MYKNQSRCAKCIYYGKYTKTCDYILIEDRRRPCPPGDACTARTTRRQQMGGKKPKWDTELGRLLYLDGRSDAQIAEELGVSQTAVMNYRIRHWGKANTQQATPETQPESTPVPVEESPPQNSSAFRKLHPTLSVWQHRMESTAFWKRLPNPKRESKQYVQRMRSFASGIGDARTICVELGQQLTF